MAEKKSATSYREAGVDIDAADRLVGRLGAETARTRRPGADAAIGGFGGLFDLAALCLKDPLLVAATDGVGTKLEVAAAASRLRGIGVDLVAMCANDVLAQGAEPLFFLDYYACGRLDPDAAAEVVAGIADGCVAAGAALIGGETAEMPGFYPDGRFDLAGFCVGAVERAALLPRPDVRAGDAVIALPASGVHANGFSLVRRVLANAGLGLDDPAPFDPSRDLAAALLEPTRIYVRPVLAALRDAPGIAAIAHVTGGGLTDNLPRVLPDGVSVAIDLAALPRRPVFPWLRETGGIADREMLRTFNCGVGMALLVERAAVEAVCAALARAGEAPVVVGEVIPREAGRVVYRGDLFG